MGFARDAAEGVEISEAIGERGMLDEVLDGLARTQKELSSKYFYDHRGSELFERITQLPEYYLSRTEEALLEKWVPEWVRELRPRTLVELGAGSARKTRTLLDAMTRAGSGQLFVPVDVSGDFLRNTVHQVRREYPDFSVEPVIADITEPIRFDDALPAPTLVVLLGSTIGNFPDDSGIRLLSSARSFMREGDRLLMGADLRPSEGKPVTVIESAYNDEEGVTAEFNLNVLRVLNRELGTDFELGGFRHVAFYDEQRGRIEMHLESQARQVVHFPDGPEIGFAPGETIRTEFSCKYDKETVADLYRASDLALDRWVQDPEDRFSVSLARPV